VLERSGHSRGFSSPGFVSEIAGLPLPAVAHQASFQNLIQEAEINCLHAKSADKDFIVVEGSMTSVGASPTAPDRRQNIPMPAKLLRLRGKVDQ
jgi:hypothetical protein